jgi:hypothetical protein
MIVFTEKRAAEYTDHKLNESEAKGKLLKSFEVYKKKEDDVNYF